jgi:hypothetical protein
LDGSDNHSILSTEQTYRYIWRRLESRQRWVHLSATDEIYTTVFTYVPSSPSSPVESESMNDRVEGLKRIEASSLVLDRAIFRKACGCKTYKFICVRGEASLVKGACRS